MIRFTMRLRRRLTKSFGMLWIPAICGAITFYFGYSGIFGGRGLLAWNEARAELRMSERELSQLRTEREALEHRIALLNEKALDPDLLEEVTRGILFQARPGEVAVPRENR